MVSSLGSSGMYGQPLAAERKRWGADKEGGGVRVDKDRECKEKRRMGQDTNRSGNQVSKGFNL